MRAVARSRLLLLFGLLLGGRGGGRSSVSRLGGVGRSSSVGRLGRVGGRRSSGRGLGGLFRSGRRRRGRRFFFLAASGEAKGQQGSDQESASHVSSVPISETSEANGKTIGKSIQSVALHKRFGKHDTTSRQVLMNNSCMRTRGV